VENVKIDKNALTRSGDYSDAVLSTVHTKISYRIILLARRVA